MALVYTPPDPIGVSVARAREDAVRAMAAVETVALLLQDRSNDAEAGRFPWVLTEANRQLRRALDRLCVLADPSGPWPRPDGGIGDLELPPLPKPEGE